MEFFWSVCDMNKSVQSENNMAECILNFLKFSNADLVDPI